MRMANSSRQASGSIRAGKGYSRNVNITLRLLFLSVKS
jgi:hypothetical protein